jgi:hypothetical protein
MDKILEAEELKIQQKYKGAIPKKKLLVAEQKHFDSADYFKRMQSNESSDGKD